MAKHRSEKINNVLNEHNGDLNLHEIKAKTGAGSGHKYSKEATESTPIIKTSDDSPKSEKIHEAVSETEGKVNLHKIKAQTGAGNGYSNTNEPVKNPTINDALVNTNKFDKINKVVNNIEGKANLHKIKAQTGAGNGYVDSQDLNTKLNTPTCDSSNTSTANTHKSHKIHAVFHAHDRKLNLHEIKAKTGAGSGHKH